MNFGLRPKELETLRAIFQRFSSITEVRIFGSRATGNSRRASDIDLAIQAPGMTPSEWGDLSDALENAPIIYELDVVRADQLGSGSLLKKIQEQGIVFYKSTN